MRKINHKFLGSVIALFIFNSSFLIPNCQCQWVQVNNGMSNKTVQALAYNGSNLFAGANNGFGVFLSTNNGLNWTQTSLNNRWVYSLAVNGNSLFAGTLYNGVYLSTDNGTSWTQTFLNNQTIYSLAANGNNLFAGCGNNQGIYLSTDNGTSWIQTSLNNKYVNALAVNGGNIFAGTGGGYGVYESTNNGTSWTQTSLNNQNIYSLAANGNNLFAGTTSNGVFKSTDNGTSWTQTSLNNRWIYSLAASGNNIFASYDTINIASVYVSNNNGTNWTQRNEGLGNFTVYAFCILNNYIFAGTYNNGVYRRPLSELTGITSVSNEIPKSFSLSQNYPNPFNPVTIIKFQIANSSKIKLKIYDVLGREVAILVNEQLQAGSYSVEWNAVNYPSGVYFYKLESGTITETKKMVLIK